MIAVDSHLLECFIHRAEAARDLRAINIGERVGKTDQVLLFGKQVLGHTAVALPSIGSAILWAGAGDHVPAAAVIAHPASRDVIHDHPVAHLEPAAARAGRDDLSRRLVSGDHALVAFRAFSEMLAIDSANIRAANGRSFHGEKHLAMSRLRYRNISYLDGAVPRKKRRFHHLAHPV